MVCSAGSASSEGHSVGIDMDHVPADQLIVRVWEPMHLLGELAPDGRFDEIGELYRNGGMTKGMLRREWL